MDKKQADFVKQAFGDHADELVTVKYESQQHALDFMWSMLRSDRAIGLVHGPEGSGKSTTAYQFAGELPRDTASAIIDGTRAKPRGLMSSILAQFGYEPDLQTTDELLQMVEMFAKQQTRTYQAPVLIIDNADRMFPSALKLLGELASIIEQGRPAMRIILTSRRLLDDIPGLGEAGIAGRPIETLALGPMTNNEALIYLHTRLEACGVGTPDSIFPGDVCDRLSKLSAGWPGALNARALATAMGSESLTGSIPRLETSGPGDRPLKPPKIIVSRDARTVEEHEFKERKVLVGRSEFADVVVDDEFCSKFHVLLLLYSDGLVMLDLNSANGTTVNSVRVKSTLLLEGDIISLGHHRLKVVNVPVPDAGTAGRATIADTTRMRNLDELRRKRAAQLQVVPSGTGPGKH